MRKSILGLLMTAIMIAVLALFPVNASAEVSVRQRAEEKAQMIYEECIESGVTGDYAIALWLHDWLIYNATFDRSYTYYGPEGVLLYGKGVCQSYALAYQMLLNCAGIENRYINAMPLMDHAWNMAKLDGVWCHIDCTWDDPSNGGEENHAYFGISDELMRRDHQWPEGNLPEADDLQSFYPVVSGAACAANRDEMMACLDNQAAAKQETLFVCYTGSDSDFSLQEVLEYWFGENNWKYGLAGYGVKYYGYTVTITMSYTTPWQKPSVNQPINSPDFALATPNGRYSKSSFYGNGLVLILGSSTDRNTTNLLSRVNSAVPGLNSVGVSTIVGIDGAYSDTSLAGIASNYPNFEYAYGTDVLWSMLEAAGYDTSGRVIYPIVFVLNGAGQIVDYSVGPVGNTDRLLSTAYTTATGNPLPEPETLSDTGACNVSLNGVGGSTVQKLRQLGQGTDTVLFLYDFMFYDNEIAQMEHYENNYELYRKMNIRLAVCVSYISSAELARYREAYPHVDILNDDGRVMWPMLYAVGWPNYTNAYYSASYLINSSGYIVNYTNGTQISCSSLLGKAAYNMSLATPLPASLTVIEEYAFEATCFTTIDFTNTNISLIKSDAFLDCTMLQIVKIPAGVTVENGAFNGCPNLLILCDFGSSAYFYAVNNGIPYLTRN